MVTSLETAQRLSQPVTASLYEREGETRQEFLLNKRDSLLTVSRISPGFTAAMLDRWQERERNANIPDFTNPAAAARAWAEQYEKCHRAEEQLALWAPKAAFFDQFVRVKESMGFRQLCKMLKAKEPQFASSCWSAISCSASAAIWFRRSTISTRAILRCTAEWAKTNTPGLQARFTARGVKWVADLWSRHLSTLAIELPREERSEGKCRSRAGCNL
ncbi:Uncharacterized phage-encoded protein [Leclercia adecarboxylata]|uniref:Uncharacterized phage-encoded protein n=1 Tax=Leclercia adecarboxylata TaxID=83655 RepID=A0A4U9HX60_9ENTR|nr:Uncharacterized phage-encoded protein [Leclercia adecarboxylata]